MRIVSMIVFDFDKFYGRVLTMKSKKALITLCITLIMAFSLGITANAASSKTIAKTATTATINDGICTSGTLKMSPKVRLINCKIQYFQ